MMMHTETPTHYTVANRRTGTVKTYKTRSAARRAADRADLAYGAVCCTVTPVYAK